MEALDTKDTWSDIRALIESGDREALMAWLDAQPAGQMGLLFSRLNSDEVQEIIRLVGPEEAAEILVQISEAQAVDIVEDLPSESAAAIVDEMDSDEQADILGGMMRRMQRRFSLSWTLRKLLMRENSLVTSGILLEVS